MLKNREWSFDDFIETKTELKYGRASMYTCKLKEDK